ncbi:helix-turn-helix domain-containing protein [Neobacillus sp. NRS-1170]|uniref:helix-turn-helix domain-containing protein n=1 Tax=Neobacillus sp. NRS-1170 TaxID=3233898 RepID=UPI003D266BDA
MLGKKIKKARLAKKLTQQQLAEMVNTKKTTISNYENEYSSPSSTMLADLANALGVTTDYLLSRTNADITSKFIWQAAGIDTSGLVFDVNLGSVGRQIEEWFELEFKLDLFDFEQWKALSPKHIKLINEHFMLVVKLAKESEKKVGEL